MSGDFDTSALLGEFREEARQQIDVLDRSLVRIEEEGDLPDEAKTELQRHLHTLKGNSAMLGYRVVADQMHAIETVVNRGGPERGTGALDVLFELSAALRSAVDHLGGEGEEDALARLAAFDLERRLADAVPSGAAGAAGGESTSEAATRESPTTPRADAEMGTTEVLRVPFAKLDALLARVAELFTLRARLDDFLDQHHDALTSAGLRRDLEEQVQDLADLATGLRDTTMDLRLVPLQTLFGRFPTMVRELAREQGKRARMELRGESIQVDKSAVDALAEPLLHLVRNAVDHGIETPEERERAGKDATGTIQLEARRDGDQIRVTVTDDGSGIDVAGIRARAAAAGMAVPEDPRELIFSPGFSTRTEATTVSGRGMGLDIVQRGVTQLRGMLSVEAADPGTRFVLRMPLTLAIVPALIFESAGEILALPASDVRETLDRRTPERAAGARVVRHDDSLVPLADPLRLFGWDEQRQDRKSYPIVVRRGERAAAVPADRLIDQRNVVVTALPSYLGTVPGVSGAIVAADGRVILLLDPDGMLDLNLNEAKRTPPVG